MEDVYLQAYKMCVIFIKLCPKWIVCPGRKCLHMVIYKEHVFIINKVMKYRKNIDEIYCIFYIFTSENIKFYIFTPPECTYNYINFLDYL